MGATTDRFLNGFVDQYNRMGHDGRFVDDAFRADVTAAGFHVETDKLCRYTWDFSGEDEMVEFIRLMFWLDKATPEIILEGVRDILGVDAVGGDSKMNGSCSVSSPPGSPPTMRSSPRHPKPLPAPC